MIRPLFVLVYEIISLILSLESFFSLGPDLTSADKKTSRSSQMMVGLACANDSFVDGQLFYHGSNRGEMA